MQIALALVALVALAACHRPPKPLAGEFAPVTVAAAQSQPQEGVAVRWGGTLVQTIPARDQTCFEIVSRPLDGQARPIPSDETAGRFLACTPGFYDPAIYLPGRDITVTGALHGVTVRKVGDADYSFPRVDATTAYLWPDRPVPSSPPVSISIGGIFGGRF